MIFNLKKYITAAERQKYKEPSDWYPLDKVLNGEVEAWNNISKNNKTYQSAAMATKKKQNACSAFFSQRYGMTSEEIADMYQVYLGFQPRHGVYALHIGPYKTTLEIMKAFRTWAYLWAGENNIDTSNYRELINKAIIAAKSPEHKKTVIKTGKDKIEDGDEEKSGKEKSIFVSNLADNMRLDRSNAFSFFTQRFQSANEDTILQSLKTYLGNKLPEFLGIIDESDIMIELNINEEKNVKGSTKVVGKKQYVNDIGKGGSGLAMLKNNDILMDNNTKFVLKPTALYKILMSALDGKQSPLVLEVLSLMSKRDFEDGDELYNYIIGNTVSEQLTQWKNLKLIKKVGIRNIFSQAQKMKKNYPDKNFAEILKMEQSKYNPKGNESMRDLFNKSLEKAATDSDTSADQLKNTINDIGSGKTNIENEEMLQESLDTMHNVYQAITDTQAAMKKSGDPRAENLISVPNPKNIKKRKGGIGAQRPTPLTVNATEKAMLAIKIEMLGYMIKNKSENPEVLLKEISDTRALSTKKTKAVGQFDENAVNYWIGSIKREMHSTQPPKSLEQMLQDAKAVEAKVNTITQQKYFSFLIAVLETTVMTGSENPQTLLIQMQTKKEGKKNKPSGTSQWTVEDVNKCLVEINKLKTEDGAKSNVQLLSELKSELDNIKKSSKKATDAYPNLEACYQGAELYLIGGSPELIDPLSGARLSYDTEKLIIPRGEIKNITSKDLTVKRNSVKKEVEEDKNFIDEAESAEQADENTDEETETDADKDEKADKPEEVPPPKEPTKTEEQFDVSEVKPEEQPTETIQDFPINEVDETDETDENQELVDQVNNTNSQEDLDKMEEEEFERQSLENQRLEKERIEKQKLEEQKKQQPLLPQFEKEQAFASSIKNMIKCAKELDDEGKTEGAEELHRIIRKYFGKKAE